MHSRTHSILAILLLLLPLLLRAEETTIPSRIVSVGSLSAAASAVAGAGVEKVRTGDRVPLAFAGMATVLICIRHAPNLRRLLRGQEPRVSLRRSSGGS